MGAAGIRPRITTGEGPATVKTHDDPVHAALASRLGDEAATALLTRLGRYSNHPNTVAGVAGAPSAPDVEAAALAAVEDPGLLGALGFGVDSDPLDGLARMRFWGLLTLAARADVGVVDRVAYRFGGLEHADRLMAAIRRAAGRHTPTTPRPTTPAHRPVATSDETIVDASPAQVIRVLEQVVDLPWPDAGVDDPIEWELEGLEGHTTWLTHVLPLAVGADPDAAASLIIPLIGLADHRWRVRHRFDATLFTDDASTPQASYDRRSAPASLVRALGADHTVWWPYDDHALALVDTSASATGTDTKAVVLVLPIQWLTAPGKEEAALESPLVQDLVSGDERRVLSAVWAIRSTRDPGVLAPLVTALPLIEQATEDLELGGALLSNSSNLEAALDRIRLFGTGACLCTAYPADQSSDPTTEEERDHVRVVETIPNDGQWVPDRICECTTCRRRYRVEEGLYHYPWWKWTPLDEQGHRRR